MTSLIAKTYTGDTLWSELGGTYEQRSFDRKIQALTKPGEYAADRTAELAKIKNASESAFKTSYDGFMQAGLAPDQAKAAAFQSASAEYANQMRVFNLMFGQGTDQMYQTRMGHPTFRALIDGAPAPHRAAQTKRRRRRKKNSK